MRLQIATLMGLSLLVTGAHASEVELAERASEAVDAHCSDAAQADVTLAAESVAQVSAVWAELSKAYESSPQPFLLYWRGILGQCLDQEDKAEADLQAFVAEAGDDPALRTQVNDAGRRLRFLAARRRGGVDPKAPGIVAGISLGAVGGLFGGLSGWRWAEAVAVGAEIHRGDHIGNDLATYASRGDEAARSSHAFAATGASLGVAALVTWAITGATGGSAPIAAAVTPRPDGLTLSLGGRW